MSFSLRSPVAREWLSQQREKVKPWSEFADVGQFKKPESPQELKKVILKNIEVYHANYLVRKGAIFRVTKNDFESNQYFRF